MGYVACPGDPPAAAIGGVPVLGTVDRLREIVREAGVAQVVVSLACPRYSRRACQAVELGGCGHIVPLKMNAD